MKRNGKDPTPVTDHPPGKFESRMRLVLSAMDMVEVWIEPNAMQAYLVFPCSYWFSWALIEHVQVVRVAVLAFPVCILSTIYVLPGENLLAVRGV